MKWHKLMFVLPNAFTVSSIFCGFYAIVLCASSNPTAGQLYSAALAIFFAIFFDGFDGRVARLTRTQSDFGVELDSLADVISFGVAPALLVYKWALTPLGFAGTFVAFAFATCGALRLARFNVMAQRKVPGSSRFFTGLPIPLAAGVLISLVIAYHHAGLTPVQTHVPIAVLVMVLALLMVSTIRYRTFKDVRPSRKSATIFLAVVLAGIAVATQMKPSFVLVAYFSAYLLLGLAEEVLFFKRRRLEARAATPLPVSAVPAPPVAADDDEDDEDDSEEFV
jgi:CDP-diacylglycerol--serine O-phosphatidyltransferase